MTYKKLRPQIKTGDMFFTRSVGIVGAAIRGVTQGAVSHVGIFYWERGRLFVAEATFSGFRPTLASKRVAHGDCYWGRTTRETNDEETIFHLMYDKFGDPYDWIGAIKAPFVDTKTSDPFCSEAISKILGIPFDSLNRGVFPLDLANTCDKLVPLT